jgi:hypothetical protein
MSELSKNQLLTRRIFFQRAANSAKAAGLGAALIGLAKRDAGAAGAERNPWAYDDSAFRKTDPKLLRYREVKRFSLARSGCRCLSLGRDERLWIGGGRFVLEYGLNGTQHSEVGVDGEIRCLGLADGMIYAGFRDHIELYDRKGQRKTAWEAPGKKPYFTAVAVGVNDVFVADAGNRLVWRYDRSGKLIGRIGEKNKERNIPGFIVPSPFFDVEIGADGLLRVCNPGRHRVEAYTFDGDLEFAWGTAGAAIESFCGCCNPSNLALLPDGRTVTFEKGIPRVKVYTADGRLDAVVAGAETFAENAKVCGPNDCTLGGLDGVVDAQGRVYTLDLVANHILVMERNPA